MPHRLRLFVALVAILLPVLSLSAEPLPDPDRHPGSLWIAEDQGLAKIATYPGELRFELPAFAATEAFAVDRSTGRVWAYGGRTLSRLTPEGAVEIQFDLPSLPATPASALVVDDRNERVWLAVDAALYAISWQGEIQFDIVLPAATDQLAMDLVHETLWAGTDKQLLAFGADGSVLHDISYAGTGRLHGIHFDAGMDRLWVASHDGVLWYTAQGVFGGAFASTVSPFPRFISADGKDTVWLASNH